MPQKTPDERIADLTFPLVYDCYRKKVEKKGKSTQELDQIISWLTGFSQIEIESHKDAGSNFLEFFADVHIHPNAYLITGVICGHRVEDIAKPLTQKVRYLDKLVDELARGKKMESIMRK